MKWKESIKSVRVDMNVFAHNDAMFYAILLKKQHARLAPFRLMTLLMRYRMY